MFTGLIETVGKVAELRSMGAYSRITIASDLPIAEMVGGESVAVDGVCLTVTALERDRFRADAVAETLRKTTLGKLRSGSLVNLERSLRVGDRLGGHLVQGHVDGTAAVIRCLRRTGDHRLRIRLGPDLRRYVAMKGSIAIQGVSLTVAAIGADWCEVALIPETLARTSLVDADVGRQVNVEVDVLSRYVESLLQGRDRTPGSTVDGAPTPDGGEEWS